MKTTYLTTVLIVIFTILFSALHADTYHSTLAGGNWNLPATWQEGVVPDATDDVVITGPGTVVVFSDYVHECNNLSVESDATLINSAAFRTLIVHGDVVNNGTITNDTDYWKLTLNIEGNIENYGTWELGTTNLTGAGTHSISCGASNPFTGYEFEAEATSGNITALTHIAFIDCRVNLYGITLNLNGGLDIIKDDATYAYLQDAMIIANDNSIYLSGGAYFNNVDVTDAAFEGVVRLSGDCIFYGDIVVEDTLQNTSAYDKLDIHGTITNNGLIRQSSSYDLEMYCFGDVVNDGVWENDELYFCGSISQTILCLNDNPFSCQIVADTSITSNSPLIAGGKVSFMGSTINLNGGEFTCYNNEIYLNDGAKMSNAILDNPIIAGEFVAINGVEMTGEIEIQDTLVSLATYTQWFLNGNVVNNGLIKRSNVNYDLNVYISGDIVNNGEWITSKTELTGTEKQFVTLEAGKTFQCGEFNDMDITAPIEAVNNLSFVNTILDMNGSEMIFPVTKGLTLSLSNCKIRDGRYTMNNGTIFMEDESWVGTDVIISDVTTTGYVKLNGSNLVFEGEIINQDTIISESGYHTTFDIDGNFTNHGVFMEEHLSSYNCDVYITGNIINNGEWIRIKTHLSGVGNHEVSQAPGSEFFGRYFFAEVGTGTTTFLTDINFRDCKVEFNNGNLVLNGDLNVSGGYLYQVNITGNNHQLHMEGGSWIGTDVIISDVTTTGYVKLNGLNIVFEGEIINQDTIISEPGYHTTFDIDGNFTNHGVFMEEHLSSYNCDVYITGNIINNGEWVRIKTHLSGAGNHEVSQAPGSEFFGRYFYAEVGTGTTTFLTDINFRDCRVDFNNENLVLNGDLFVSEEYLFQADVTGNNHQLYMDENARLSACTISDFTVAGKVRITSAGSTFEGEIIVQDTLENYANAHSTLIVNGNITNNGVIRDYNSSYNLTISTTGNIENNGIWSNQTINMNGTSDQHLSCVNDNFISSEQLFDNEISSKIIVDDEAHFTKTAIDLNGAEMEMPENGKLSVLSVNDNQGYLTDGIVSGSNFTYLGNTYSYISNMIFQPSVILEGKVRLSFNVTFDDDIIVQDTLENWTADSPTLTVNGTIYNNGMIREYSTTSYYLYITANGDIVNDGVWNNQRINFNGTTDQHISCLNDNFISCEIINDNDASSKIIVDNEAHFIRPYFNLNGAELVMPEGGVLSVFSVSGNNSYLIGGNITGGNFTYKGNPYAYLQNMTIEPSVVLEGTIKVHTNVVFNDDISVMDTLMNQSGSAPTMEVGGRIVNNGIIQDYSTSYKLTINVAEHIINNGEWINYRTFLNGTEDQLIYLIAGKEITGQVRFEAMITEPSYQWKWNGTDLNSSDFTGETSDELVWNVPVSNDYNGYFNCQGAVDSSRHILIRSGIIIDPVVQLQGPYNGTGMDTDLAAQDLIPLTQPFNVAPWNYAGDEEVTSIPTDIVDWVLVELRQTAGGPETATEATIVLRRALMLRNDGRAVDPYHQTPELKYDIDLDNNIYMVIWHRNHLGVMTAVPISDGDSPAYYDFSESSTQAYGGTDAVMDLGNGVFGMMGGDADYNQQITTQDKLGFWDPNIGLPCGYEAYDFTLDGQIDNQDKNQTWVKTLEKETQVPE